MKVPWIAVFAALLAGASAAQGQKEPPPTVAQLEARVQAGDSLDAETEFRLGRLYEFAHRYDDEERAFRTAIAADPRYAPAYLWLGDLPYVREPKLDKEEAQNRVPPQWVKALDDAARLRVQAFLIDPLVDWRARGEKPIPQDIVSLPEYKGYEKETTETLAWLGVAAYVYERYELSFSAMDLFWNRRYGSAPEDSVPDWVFFYHGLAAAHLNAWDKATADFEVLTKRARAVERSDSLIHFPLNTNQFRYVLALFKERYHKPAEAVTLYQEAITNDLGLYMAHVRLAELYRQYRMWDKAIGEAQAAVDANPEDVSLLLDLAAIDRDAGRLPDAALALQKAVTVNPRCPEVYYQLGLVTQALARPAEARAAFTHFIAVAPHRLDTEVTDAKQRLTTSP